MDDGKQVPEYDDDITEAYFIEIAPERLHAARDAMAERRAESVRAVAWDEAGHTVAAALCGVEFTPYVFTLLPDADPGERSFIWWAGPAARIRARCELLTDTADLSAAGGSFFRYEDKADMSRHLDCAWPVVSKLARRLIAADKG